jgi:hypothetical protein
VAGFRGGRVREGTARVPEQGTAVWSEKCLNSLDGRYREMMEHRNC